MAMVAWAVLVYGVMWWYLARENKRRAAGLQDHKIEGLTEEEVAEMGDESPKFVYTI